MKTGLILAAALTVCAIMVFSPAFGQDMNGAAVRATSVDFAIQLIYSGDGVDKYFGIDVLEDSGQYEPRVLDAIASCLFEGTMYEKRKAGRTVNRYWELRIRAAQALANIGDEYALPELHRALLYEDDPVVKAVMVSAIGKIGSPESIPNLLRVAEKAAYTGYKEDLVLRACIGAALDIGDEEAYWILYRIARLSCNANIRRDARDAIPRLGE